jgi:hypothetical protein
MKYIIVFIVIFLIFALYFHRRRFLGLAQWLITHPTDAKNTFNKIIEGDAFKIFKPDEGVGFSIQGWIKIENFEYNYGLEKEIFRKGFNNNLDMGLFISPEENKLIFKLRTYNTIEDKTNNNTNNNQTLGEEMVEIDVPKINVQKWEHIVINVFQDVVDIWVNGELVRSKRLHNLPRFDVNRKLYVLSGTKFQGKLSRWRYDGYTLDRDLINYYYGKNPDKFYFWDKFS